MLPCTSGKRGSIVWRRGRRDTSNLAFKSRATNFPRWPAGRRHLSVNMASQDEELDFKSGKFNPARALSSTNLQLPDPEAPEFEDLYKLRETVHGQSFNVERELPGVPGPGGIPRPMVRQAPVERKFTAEQGLIRGKGPKRMRNVITRMDEMKGPLALLTQCRDNSTRVKVYTRNHSEVRGVLTGYVVAFDKHWNLALRDVDEVFQKRLRCKAPALGDVSGFMHVGDLSIRDSPGTTDTSSDEEPTGRRGAAGPVGGGARGRGGGIKEEKRRVIGGHEAMEAAAIKSVQVSRNAGTSEAQDAHRLTLGSGSQGRKERKEVNVDGEGEQSARKKNGKEEEEKGNKEEAC
ncbi:U7 snRNA-associated Sm-like protein LSm11 [Portunus trituberculatus]|uniref:U7 snRNA-associated Sm-like protein LSm11 n=1 Tax=Portunus trituberculatus TaxID=210409 RepID=UPI001E1D0A30|nr:U7 snRNA-associated Sm-like protein LSm11 [Portunus trituberculatus]